jgi:3-deoxy-D-manno-octulosonic-acid transferase
MQWLYQLSVNLYHLSIRLASPFNPQAKKWVAGRKNIWNKLEIEALKGNRWIWFHAASLGEFEQGRPVIEAIRGKYPDFQILLTFFSPSGYEIRKNYEHVDYVSYLPSDTSRHAVRLLNTFNPKVIFFIKYEFWFNYLQAINLKQIPFYYISLKLRPDQYFFKPYGKWFREQFSAVTHFFVQDEQTAELLTGSGFLNTTVTGDTRFDRVMAIAAKAKRFPAIEKLLDNHPCIVWGSTWPQDEQFILPLLSKLPEEYRSILVPHDISKKHINQIEKQLTVSYQKWSEFDASIDSKVLLIDSIGMLSHLYQYAKLAYVGGGFGKQIHNIQEAVTFGCPVVFGPKHTRFAEAVDLVQLGGAFAINNAEGLEGTINKLLTDTKARYQASEICRDYVSKHAGATNAIMRKIEPLFRLL